MGFQIGFDAFRANDISGVGFAEGVWVALEELRITNYELQNSDWRESKVLRRLSALRATVRRRLVGYGICAVLVSGVASFLTIVTLDWLLWLPPLLRIIVGGLFIAGFVGATLHWIVKPLQARLGIDEVAARLEAHFSTLQDRLSSTVNFIEQRSAGSPSLMRQVIANTERIIKNIPLESALTLQPLMLRGVLLAVSVGVLTCILSVSPGWARTGLYRYVYPLGRIEWPRTVSILPLTGDLIAAVGDSVTVRMRIQRGLTRALRGVVHLREPGGATMTLVMQRGQDDTLYATIDAVTKDLQYWFEAGDDSTERAPYTLQVVRRPQVVEALAAVEPPPYASNRAVRVQDLGDGPVHAPIGGHVKMTLHASKPISPDPTGTELGLRTEAGGWIPLIVAPEDHHKLSARFEINRDLHFRIELRDEYGFENRGAGKHSILATPDIPPVVTVLEPKAVTELTPKGSIPLLIQVEDDFGITRLDLNVERAGGDAAQVVPLTDRLEIVRDDQAVEAMAEHLWSVESLSLAPGDVLIWTAVATDNHTARDETGQQGRSAPMHIKIISEVEFEARLRQHIALLEARVRQAALDEGEILDRTTALFRHGDEPMALTGADREMAATLATRQARLVRRLRDVADRADKLSQQMKRNHTGDKEARNRIASLSDGLLRIAGGPMTVASGALGEVREQVQPETQQHNLREAARSEERAIDDLHAVIRLMSQWGSFQELVTKTRDLLDRQNTLRSHTAQLGKTMLGKAVGSLTEEEAAKLKRTERRQEQVATDIEQLLARMSQLAGAGKEKDPSSAEAIDAALRAARAHEAAKHAHAAAKAIEANRTAAATINQKAAAEALRKMAAALREREDRELELLRKRFDRAEEHLARLIKQQQILRTATHEADLIGTDEATLSSLVHEQRTLKRNTRLLGEELLGVERAAPAARLVRQAATPMGEAEVQLRARQTAAATPAQDEAIALLQDALARFEALAREAAREALMRSLAQIREDLAEILAVQLDVNGGISKLKTAITVRGRISRREARAASKLARKQANVRAMVEAQLPDFQKVVVYEWALQRVVKWMDVSQGRLDARRIDDELAATTDRIARELEKLIGAIVDTESLPVDTDFVETAAGGGSGSAQPSESKPVPTVAELLVLKAMQVDIHERTKGLHESFDIDRATEQQLRDIEMVGEDQAEVRRLTEMVTQRVQHP
ncbi:MAG: DUF4175 family protein [Phycisphaerae bacterium]